MLNQSLEENWSKGKFETWLMKQTKLTFSFLLSASGASMGFSLLTFSAPIPRLFFFTCVRIGSSLPCFHHELIDQRNYNFSQQKQVIYGWAQHAQIQFQDKVEYLSPLWYWSWAKCLVNTSSYILKVNSIWSTTCTMKKL